MSNVVLADTASAIVDRVVFALVALAVLVALLTVWYWRATRPLHPALEPLEEMGRRRWRRRSPAERARALDRLKAMKPEDSEPVAASTASAAGARNGSSVPGSPAAGSPVPGSPHVGSDDATVQPGRREPVPRSARVGTASPPGGAAAPSGAGSGFGPPAGPRQEEPALPPGAMVRPPVPPPPPDHSRPPR